jgi:hypothetical protein
VTNIPRIWNNYILCIADLSVEFPSAHRLPEYINCPVWKIDKTDWSLLELKYG